MPHDPSRPSYAEVLLNVRQGDKISGCFALWAACDRVLEELGRCDACKRPAFRVVTITSAAGLERRTPLCGHHFIVVTRTFPELKVATAGNASEVGTAKA